MAEKKSGSTIKVTKPDNVIKKENDIFLQCEELERQLPSFLRGFFAYPEKQRAAADQTCLSARCALFPAISDQRD